MAMNILQIHDRLKGTPDSQLMQYVQQPTGEIPQFMVAAEMKRREEMRAKSAEAPTTTVVDDLEQSGLAALQPPPQEEAAPEQMEAGLAALPTDMPEAPSMAGGGIIAFEDGGDVERFAEGKQVKSSYPTFQGGMGHNAPIGYPDIGGQVEAALQQAIQGIIKKQQAGLALTQDEKNLLQSKGFINTGINVPTAATPQLLPTAAPAVTPRLNAADIKAVGADLASQPMVQPPVASPVALPPGPASAQAPQVGLGSLKYDLPTSFANVTAAEGPTLDESQYVGAAPSLEGIQSLREQAYGKAGVSEDAYNQLREKLEGRVAGIEGERGDALNKAMIMAGLGMAAGTSPFALSNVAAGGIKGMEQYTNDITRLDEKADKLGERQFAVMDAQNKYRQTGADSDLRNMQESEKEFRGAKRDYASTNAKLASDQATRDDAVTHFKFTQENENARALLSAKLQEQGLKIQSFNAQTQRMANSKPELFTTILTNLEGSKKYQDADGVGKNKLITDAISDAKSVSPGAGSKGYTYMKELEAQFSTGGNRDLIAEYGRIKKASGLAAAEQFKSDYINRRLAGQAGIAAPTASTGGWGQLQVN